MGEFISQQNQKHQKSSLAFNRSCKIDEVDFDLSSETGSLLLREIDEKFDLLELLTPLLHDNRNPAFTKFSITELLRTRLFLSMQGWRDQDDADKLRMDPALRVALSDRTGQTPLLDPQQGGFGLPSQATLSRLNLLLSDPQNLEGLKDGALKWAFKILDILGHMKETLILDLDSKFFQTYGKQGGTSANAHYNGSGYHPLLAYIAEARAFVKAWLRPGATWTSTGTAEFVEGLIEKIRGLGKEVLLRADAGFANDEILSFLEERTDEGGAPVPVKYCMRLKTNKRLDQLAAHYLRRPRGRPPEEWRSWTVELPYKAASWKKARRIVLIVKENGTLHCDYFFLVTNFSKKEMDAEALWDFYRARGQMEGDLGQLSSTLNPSLSSSERQPLELKKDRTEEEQAAFDERDRCCNEANLMVQLLAFNMMSLMCHLMNKVAPQPEVRQTGHEPKENYDRKPVKWGWSLQRLREQVLKVAGRFRRKSRYIYLQLSQATAALWLTLQRYMVASSST